VFLKKLRSLFKKREQERELKTKIKMLEALVQLLGERAWTINIEHVSIENLRLDKLEFYLDKIDVDNLSGILNVGLNTMTTQDKHEKNSPRKPFGTCPAQDFGKKSL